MTIAVVAHDAGGAEVLSSYVRRQGFQPLLVLEGPARSVFERKLGAVQLSGLEHALSQCSQLLCGTSWQSNLEFDAIKMARGRAVPSIAFLDHWVNYAERFVRAGETCLPDEIWVGDSIAARLAREQFAQLPVRLVDNPYFEDLRAQLAVMPTRKRDPAVPLSVLYVCEPVREHALLRFGNERHFGYIEEEALRFFLDNIASLNAPVGRIGIRPHPAEAPGKYQWACHDFDLPIEIAGRRSLIEEVADCDVVVGCESMAMVVGLLAGKRVMSCIPPGGKACGLPQPQIEQLRQLASARR